MNRSNKIPRCVVHSVAAAVLLLGAQLAVAGSATWLSSPQDSTWENANNWTLGGPPNGPNDVATFSQSSQPYININSSVEVNSIVFTSGANSFSLRISSSVSCAGGKLIISGTGIIDNSSVSQTLGADNLGRIIFNNTATAADARIVSFGGSETTCGGKTIFNDSSTAGSATLVAGGGCYGDSGGIIFNDSSTGGTARVQVSFGCTLSSGNGYLDIKTNQPDMTVGSIEGDGDINVGTHRLRVGTNNLNTTFDGNIYISDAGSLAKVGSGILTLAPYYGLPDNLNLVLVSGSPLKLAPFTGQSDVIASLKINGVSQPPGIYGGPMSGAPHIVPEFRGTGTVEVPSPTLRNISTRAFVDRGDNVMIGGFMVQGTESKNVIIRAIGPELTQYGIPNSLNNPTLELHDRAGALIAANDNWHQTIIGGIIRYDQAIDIQYSGHVPADQRESAMIVNLPAGNYTAVVRGVNNTVGVALVEVYDLSPTPNSIISNVSTRSFVQTGSDVMIGGFVVHGNGPKRVIVRAIGPELAQHGVSNPLADPTLELHNATGALIAFNDNWMTTVIGGIITRDQVQEIRDSGHVPRAPNESAIIAILQPGNYTAIVRGVNNTTGVGLVEVYDLD